MLSSAKPPSSSASASPSSAMCPIPSFPTTPLPVRRSNRRSARPGRGMCTTAMGFSVPPTALLRHGRRSPRAEQPPLAQACERQVSVRLQSFERRYSAASGAGLNLGTPPTGTLKMKTIALSVIAAVALVGAAQAQTPAITSTTTHTASTQQSSTTTGAVQPKKVRSHHRVRKAHHMVKKAVPVSASASSTITTPDGAGATTSSSNSVTGPQ